MHSNVDKFCKIKCDGSPFLLNSEQKKGFYFSIFLHLACHCESGIQL